MQNILQLRASKIPLAMIVEPWANEFVLEPGQVGQVVAVHPHVSPAFEVEFVDDHLIVSVHEEGATFEFFRDGRLEFSMPVAIPYWRSSIGPSS